MGYFNTLKVWDNNKASREEDHTLIMRYFNTFQITSKRFAVTGNNPPITEPLQAWTFRGTGSKSETQVTRKEKRIHLGNKGPKINGNKISKNGNNIITSKRFAVTGNNPPLLQSHYRDGLLGVKDTGCGYLVVGPYVSGFSMIRWSAGSKSETESRENRSVSTWEKERPKMETGNKIIPDQNLKPSHEETEAIPPGKERPQDQWEQNNPFLSLDYVQAFCSYRKQPTLLQSHYRDGLLGGIRYGKWLLGYRPIPKRILNDSQEDSATEETFE
ncbi:hypothetical protein CEXT_598481 [Caerostris extrusa]|uniref:Uncharacterized protein n=1 Tax=Caerostris extrusa TaxID=172846 RepID=A0AAV4RAS4_CAEEX|nr:hypothetical protein CEXT_598481 [Caerostris extrusa]